MRRQNQTVVEELRGTLNEMLSQLKKLIREGNARHLVIKNRKGEILFQSKLTIGVAGTAFFTAIAPIISAVTMFVMFMNDVTILVERDLDPEEDEYEVEADIIEIEEDETDQNEQDSRNKQDIKNGDSRNVGTDENE